MVLSFSSLLVCLGLITQNAPRIFLNYSEAPYTFPYLFTVFALATSMMILGFVISKPKMNAWLQSKWIRILCFFLLVPLWISPSIDAATRHVQSFLLALHISTATVHLWFGWFASMGVALLFAQWFVYLNAHQKQIIDLILPSALLASCLLLSIAFFGAGLFSAVLILAVTLVACNSPKTSAGAKAQERQSQKPGFKNLSFYLCGVFLIGLSYQVIASISYTSKIDVNPNYLYLVACLFIIFVLVMQLRTIRKVQGDAIPYEKFTASLVLIYGALIAARTLWVSIVNFSLYNFWYGISSSIYILAAVCLEMSLLLFLFRAASYLKGSALKHILLGNSVFLLGATLGIIAVAYYENTAFFTKSIGPETVALITLICATFLVSLFSLSNRDSIMRAIFGDGEFPKLPGDTRFLEKTPLKAQCIAQKYGLDDTETAVMELLASGHSSSQIAAQLYLSTKTIPHYRDDLFKKLNVHKKDEIADLFDSITDEELGLSS